jgi:hypothetical protein
MHNFIGDGLGRVGRKALRVELGLKGAEGQEKHCRKTGGEYGQEQDGITPEGAVEPPIPSFRRVTCRARCIAAWRAEKGLVYTFGVIEGGGLNRGNGGRLILAPPGVAAPLDQIRG